MGVNESLNDDIRMPIRPRVYIELPAFIEDSAAPVLLVHSRGTTGPHFGNRWTLHNRSVMGMTIAWRSWTLSRSKHRLILYIP